MDCLVNYIGLKGCCEEEPESGVYLNDLPGITLESIEKISEREQVSYKGVWNDIQKRALRKFGREFTSKLSELYNTNCCNEDCSIEDLICGSKESLIDVLLFSFGIQLMLERLYSSRLNSFTTIDRDQAAELKDFYQVEYERALELAVKNLPKSLIDGCFNCVSRVQYVERLP